MKGILEKEYDYIIVGAGPVGCVIAQQAAAKGFSSLIIEKRDHLGGNCYDSTHESGVRIHNYGPHYFRTNDDEIIAYLSNYTDWIDGDYIVKSMYNDELYPFPINLETLEKFFQVEDLTKESAIALLEKEKIGFQHPKNSEEFVLNRVGKRLFDAFYKNYTFKQWGKHASELAPSVCGRIPVKFNRDPYYVNHKFRKMPKNGFTEMFTKIVDNERIMVALNTDFFEVKDTLNPKAKLVYTGPIDRFFDHQFGKLQWRSLRFEFTSYPIDFKQPCVQINYPNEHNFTRSVEIKHVTKQKLNATVVCKEYPTWEGDPYYPVLDNSNQDRYLKYKALSQSMENTYFIGRLAEYTYINTDEAIKKALHFGREI